MRESSNFGKGVSEARLQCIKNEKERKKKGKLLFQEEKVSYQVLLRSTFLFLF